MTILTGASSKEDSLIFMVQIKSFSTLHCYHTRSIEEPYYKDCVISDALNWVTISNANSEASYVDEEDTALTTGDMNSRVLGMRASTSPALASQQSYIML
jgi:hypothetical protein